MITRAFIAFVVFALMCAGHCLAHPADISQLRVRVEHDRVEFRFSINIATIARVVTIDANQDNHVSYAEITAAVPALRDYLAQSALVTINDEDASLGEFVKHECVWPNAETTMITPQDAGQRFVDFNFTMRWPKGVQEVWLGFKVFERFGDLHVIQCIYQQPGEHDTPVDFSANEPDYLYDTGWLEGEFPAPTNNATAPLVTANKASTATNTRWMYGVVSGVFLLAIARWWTQRRRLGKH